MGAWIEIVCFYIKNIIFYVAPLVGAWIEIYHVPPCLLSLNVAPLVGAWIEIYICLGVTATLSSLLSWERGLKFSIICIRLILFRRSSRGIGE